MTINPFDWRNYPAELPGMLREAGLMKKEPIDKRDADEEAVTRMLRTGADEKEVAAATGVSKEVVRRVKNTKGLGGATLHGIPVRLHGIVTHMLLSIGEQSLTRGGVREASGMDFKDFDKAFTFLERNGYIAYDPRSSIPRPYEATRVGKQLIKTLKEGK